MSLKDFDAARQERKRLLTPEQDQPIVFKIGGHEFVCAKVLPYGLVLDIALVPEDAPQVAQVAALDNLMYKMIRQEHHEKWQELTRDPEEGLDLEDIKAIVSWMMEQYTGRPTVPSSTSVEP